MQKHDEKRTPRQQKRESRRYYRYSLWTKLGVLFHKTVLPPNKKGTVGKNRTLLGVVREKPALWSTLFTDPEYAFYSNKAYIEAPIL